MLTSRQVQLINQSIQDKSLKDLKNTLANVIEEDLPEAYIRIAYGLCPSSKRKSSKFNLDKLGEIWENFGIDPKHVKGVIKEMKRLLN